MRLRCGCLPVHRVRRCTRQRSMQLVRVLTFCGLLFTTVHSYSRQETSIERVGGKEGRRGRKKGDGEGSGEKERREEEEGGKEWRRRGGGDEREEKGVEKERGTRRRKGWGREKRGGRRETALILLFASKQTSKKGKTNEKYVFHYTQVQPDNSPCVWNRMDYRPLEGFIASISPFNFTAIGTNLSATPTLMGNVVVWKPSNTSLLSNWTYFKIYREAGMPDGVINFVPTRGTDFGNVTTSSPHLAAINFTGSNEYVCVCVCARAHVY